MNKQPLIKILIVISTLVLIFHVFILLKVIPYEITWGGRLKNDQDMYVFESFSIIVNVFFIYVLLQKGNFVKAVFSEKVVSFILWIFFALFVLNTIGNVLAKTLFEKVFTVVTLLNAGLLWQINKTTYRKEV
jgi:membrane protease YdiL (CAAX protease family)